jgi:hypothetical protein
MRAESEPLGVPARIAVSILIGLVVLGVAASASAATLTIRNNCGYTIYPGIYPPVYQNGGWSQAPGASVNVTIASGWIGRVWGRTGCNGASPAQCTTGSCGGTGLQCAGTTGFPNTSLFEANINANGTDWYDISYVDAVDSPMGLAVTNGSCISPNTCSNSVISNCPAGLRSGSVCLSPCTRYNTDQFCCRGAFGLPSTCVVSNWSGEAQTYVNNIHSFCPRQYSYAYDEVAGGALHTCATGINYTLTFCPSGGGTTQPTPTRPPTATPTTPPTGGGAIVLNAFYTLQNRASGKCMDARSSATANGTVVQQYTCNNTFAQHWQFQDAGGGFWRINQRNSVPQVWDVSGVSTANGALIHLWSYVAGANQQWSAESMGGGYYRFHARHSGRCLDVPNGAATESLQLQQYDCNTSNAQQFSLIQR